MRGWLERQKRCLETFNNSFVAVTVAIAAAVTSPSLAVVRRRSAAAIGGYRCVSRIAVPAGQPEYQIATRCHWAAVGSPIFAAAVQPVTAALVSRVSAARSGVEYASRMQMRHTRREHACSPRDMSAGK